MDPGTTLALCATALAAGTIDAIAGGGGLITLPALLIAGLPVELAIATNKGQSTFGSCAALAGFWKAGAIDRSRARVTFPLAFTGSLAGAALVLAVPAPVLRPVVLGLLLVAGIALALKPELGSVTGSARPIAHAALRAGAIALVLGVYDGFFGPGVGTFLILAQVLWLADPMARASANAKVMNFASNLAALALFSLHGSVQWQVALPMAAAQFVGGWLGARLTLRRGDRFVRWMVLLVVAGLLVRLAWDLTRSHR